MTQSENRAAAGIGARGWVAAAALSGGVSVAVGAFAAHGLDPIAQATEIGWLHTGGQYQAVHALAMLAVVALADGLSRQWAKAALYLFMTGSILFPAALYGLALHLPRWLGAVAPIGGASFIAGWIALAIAALRRDSD